MASVLGRSAQSVLEMCKKCRWCALATPTDVDIFFSISSSSLFPAAHDRGPGFPAVQRRGIDTAAAHGSSFELGKTDSGRARTKREWRTKGVLQDEGGSAAPHPSSVAVTHNTLHEPECSTVAIGEARVCLGVEEERRLWKPLFLFLFLVLFLLLFLACADLALTCREWVLAGAVAGVLAPHHHGLGNIYPSLADFELPRTRPGGKRSLCLA
eukprot:3000888-Rhodomonas_salina.1